MVDDRKHEQFNPQTIKELSGYEVWEIVAMYEDYERMAKELRQAEKDIESMLSSDCGDICQFCAHYKNGCGMRENDKWCGENAMWRGLIE